MSATLDLGFLTFRREGGSPRAEFSPRPQSIYPTEGVMGVGVTTNSQKKKPTRDAHIVIKISMCPEARDQLCCNPPPCEVTSLFLCVEESETGREVTPFILRLHLQMGDPSWRGRGQQSGVIRGQLGRGLLMGPLIL